jgi:hypothetical protein
MWSHYRRDQYEREKHLDQALTKRLLILTINRKIGRQSFAVIVVVMQPVVESVPNES